MALFLYRKFFKKNSIRVESQRPACIHEQEVYELHGISGEPRVTTRHQDENHNADENTENRDKIHIQGAPSQPVQHATSPCKICEQEKKEMLHYRLRIIFGLFLPFTIQSMNVTIIASALPFIASDFNQLSQINWIVSTFNLTSAAFIPFWGSYCDIFGRFLSLQIALIITIIGSALCSGSPVTAFPMLLVGRAIQGIGCSGLLINTKVILADKVSLEENAKNNSIFTLVGGIGYTVGPIVGGYLTSVSWRWAFIINVPMGVAGIVLAHFLLRPILLGPQKITRTDHGTGIEIQTPQSFAARLSTLDLGGQLLFLFGMGLFILALTWAGTYYPWSDVKVLAPLIVGVVLVICFLVWEYFLLPGRVLSIRFPTTKAMIPINLLFTRNAGLLIYLNFITGMAMYAVFYFVGLYFALVRGITPGDAGKDLIYYMPGLGAGAYIAMFCCNVWPLQTIFPLFLGTILEPLGITVLAIAMKQDHLGVVYGMLGLTGAGTGIRLMPGTLHGIAYFPNEIASVVSLMSLALTSGGTMATTIMLNIFNNYVSKSGISFTSASASSLDTISQLPKEQRELLAQKAREGIILALYAITSFMWLGILAAASLGNVRIGKKGTSHPHDETVEKGSFIGELLWRKSRRAEEV